MLQFCAQLRDLHSIRCYPASRSSSKLWPMTPCSSINSPATPVLPQLLALSFAGSVTSLQQLSTLAPNLQELSCDAILLSSQSAGSLRHLQRLSVCHVSGLSDASAVAASFPQLKATFQLAASADTPRAAAVPPSAARVRRPFVPGAQLQVMRLWGGSRAWMQNLIASEHRERLRQLQWLTWHNADLQGYNYELMQLLRLVGLSITFEVRHQYYATALEDIRTLRTLKKLALPAKLLCSSCSAWGRAATLPLLQPSTSTATDGPQQQLQQLVFLSGSKRRTIKHALGTYCYHMDDWSWPQLIADLTSAQPQQTPPPLPAPEGAAAAAPGAAQSQASGTGLGTEGHDGVGGRASPLDICVVVLPDDMSRVGVYPSGSVQRPNTGRSGMWGSFGIEWYN